MPFLQQFVRNQGDAWAWTLELLGREIERLSLLPEREATQIEDEASFELHYVRTIARRIAEMHPRLRLRPTIRHSPRNR